MKKTRWMALLAVLLFAGVASATLYPDWDVNSGDWSTAGSWDGGDGDSEPTSNDYAYISNGGTALITQDGEVASRIYVGDSASSSGTISMGAGSLMLVGNGIVLGNASNSTGTLYQSGGTLTSAQSLVTGVAGTGRFIQSGGTNSIGGSLYVGYYPDTDGKYSISGGVLSATEIRIGRSDGTSLFEVDGSGSAINLGDRLYCYGNAGVGLVSKLDADGIGTIIADGLSTLAGTWTVLDDGARAGTYSVLISKTGIGGSFDTVNLPAGWTWGIDDTATTDTLWVRVPPTGFLFALSSRSVPPVPIVGMATLAEKEVVVEQLLGTEWKSPEGITYSAVFYGTNQRITQYDIFQTAPDPDLLSADDLAYVQLVLDPVTVNGMPQYLLQESPLEDVESYEDCLRSTSTYLSGLYFKYLATSDSNVLQQASEVFSTLYSVYELGLQDQPGWIPKPYGFKNTQQSSMDNQCPYYMSLIRYHEIAPPADQALVQQVLTDQMDYWMTNDYHMHVPYFGIDIDYATDNYYPGHWPLMFLPLAYGVWEMTGDGKYLTEFNRLVGLLDIPAGADPDYLNTYIRAYHRWYLQYDWLLEMGAPNADLWREGLGYQEAVMAPLSLYHSLACAIRIDDEATAAWKIGWLPGYLLELELKDFVKPWPEDYYVPKPQAWKDRTVQTVSIAIWFERYWQGRYLEKW